MQNRTTFSIIIPLYNEEENVNPLVEKLLKVVGRNHRLLEIILVDDGSIDTTAEKCLELSQQHPEIKTFRHKGNRGLGAAIRTGLEMARGDFILYTDADLPFDFNLIPQLFELADENRVIAGQRINRGEGIRRLVLTKAYNFLVWFLFGLSLKDANFACKIFPKQFTQKIQLNSEGSFIDVEMLLESRRIGLEIIEFPMVYYPRERGLSTLSRPSVIIGIVKEMITYAANLSFSELALLPKNWRLEQKLDK